MEIYASPESKQNSKTVNSWETCQDKGSEFKLLKYLTHSTGILSNMISLCIVSLRKKQQVQKRKQTSDAHKILEKKIEKR